MKWHTEITVPPLAARIDHATSVAMFGSCFTDEIGSRLRRQLFDVAVNPLGTLFNPISIADAIDDALNSRRFSRAELFESEGTWRTLRRHSRFALPDPDDTLAMLNDTLDATRARLLSSDILIVTFGSAVVHRHLPSGRIAANCHKLPSSDFAVEPLSVSNITARWQPLLDTLFRLRPGLRVIFTVSPVRHTGYGLTRDRLSKSTLIVAVNQLLADRVHYFPSYEIMVDDLRDYRWYADDMVHPSAQAVDYIYDIFRRSSMTTDTIALADRWGKITRRLDHRHSSPGAQARFTADTMALAKALAGNNSTMFQRFSDFLQ